MLGLSLVVASLTPLLLSTSFASATAPAGQISTVAGDGSPGYSGNGGPATSAELNAPWGAVVDSQGDMLIVDSSNSVVRMVAASDCTSGCRYGLSPTIAGDIYTVAGDGTFGYSGDGSLATSAELRAPLGVAVDSEGNILIADTSNERIRMVAASDCTSGCPYGLGSTTAGYIYTVAGDGTFGYSGDGALATSAEFESPWGVAVDSHGNLLIADEENERIRMVAASDCTSGCPYGLGSTTADDIYTVAGDGTFGYSGDGGPATSAELRYPSGVALDSEGDLLIGDTSNDRIRMVAASDCTSGCPYGLSSTTADDIYTVAGDGTAGYTGDGGPATSAELAYPTGVAVDSHGNLLIADTENDVIRLVQGAQAVTPSTVAIPQTWGESSSFVVAQPDGSPSVFVRGVDGSLLNFWYVSGTWDHSTVAPSGVISSPVAVLQPDGSPSVFVEGTGGTLMNYWYVKGTWDVSQVAASGVAATPVALVQANGAPTVFVRTSSDALLNYWYIPSSGTWGAGTVAGTGWALSDPGAITQLDGAPSLVVEGPGDALLNYWYIASSGTWGAGTVAGTGSDVSTPGVIPQTTGAPTALVESTSNSLLDYSYVPSSATWTVETVAGTGSALAAPGVIAQADEAPSVLVEGPVNSLVNYWYIASSSTWGAGTVASSGVAS